MKKSSAPQKSKPRGRPREFNKDAALRKALTLFWKNGYEATSISDLKQALGIESPSLYSAFGSKEELFGECVELYSAMYLSEIMRSLSQAKSAKTGVERLLLQFASHYSGDGHPKGCLVVSAATNCSSESGRVEADLKRRRITGVQLIRQRIESGIQAGEFKGKADAEELARFYSAVLLGMAMRARDGASYQELEATARMALRGWPDGKVID
jgi:AcrR family transcriptional regulator